MPDPILSTSERRLGRSEPEIGEPVVARTRSAWRWAALPVAAAFALFGIVVWLAYVETARGPTRGEPPLIKAAADPIKLPPDEAEESTVAESSTIGRLWSDVEQGAQPERLLPLPEEPLSPPLAAAPEVSPDPDPAGRDLPPADQARELDGGPGAVATAPSSQPNEGAAMSEAEAALDRLLAEVAALSERDGAARPAPAESGATSPVPAETPRAAAERAATAAAQPATEPPAAVAPAPEPEDETTASAPVADVTPPDSQEIRPASALNASPEVETAPPVIETPPPARPAAAPQEQRQVAAVDDRYRVQLAAVRGEADAHRAWDLFMADLGDVLSDVQPFFERAETANGVFYRVQIGPFASQQAAESRCEELKRRNASCFVIRR